MARWWHREIDVADGVCCVGRLCQLAKAHGAAKLHGTDAERSQDYAKGVGMTDVSTLTMLIMVFVLSCMVGYFVVWGVTPALHTPLMAVTNAISGIVVVAAMMVAGGEMFDERLCWVVKCPYPANVGLLQGIAAGIGVSAVALCAINIFGGFAITWRMLAMFKSRKQGDGKKEQAS